MPTYYGNKTVYEMALERIEYIFDEFENVSVNFSGGKDSTVTLNLALTVAEKKGRLPLKVMFIDQEAE
jgi:predicted phosphoadenosine phosphosulfate sulfurtransferase